MSWASIEAASWILGVVSAAFAALSAVVSARTLARTKSLHAQDVKRIVCDVCEGEGEITVVREHSPADGDSGDVRISLQCPKCKGAGFTVLIDTRIVKSVRRARFRR